MLRVGFDTDCKRSQVASVAGCRAYYGSTPASGVSFHAAAAHSYIMKNPAVH